MRREAARTNGARVRHFESIPQVEKRNLLYLFSDYATHPYRAHVRAYFFLIRHICISLYLSLSAGHIFLIVQIYSLRKVAPNLDQLGFVAIALA